MTSRKPLLTGLLPSWYRVFTPVLRVFRIETSDPLSRQYPLSIRVPLIVNFFKFFRLNFSFTLGSSDHRNGGQHSESAARAILRASKTESSVSFGMTNASDDSRAAAETKRRRFPLADRLRPVPIFVISTKKNNNNNNKEKRNQNRTGFTESETVGSRLASRRFDLFLFCLFFFASDLLFHRLQTDFINNHQRWQRSRRTVRRLRRLCRSTTTTTTKGWNALASPVSDVVDSRFGRRQTKPRRG